MTTGRVEGLPMDMCAEGANETRQNAPKRTRFEGITGETGRGRRRGAEVRESVAIEPWALLHESAAPSEQRGCDAVMWE